MREVLTKGRNDFQKKISIATIEDANRLINSNFNGSIAHGSCGSWHWVSGAGDLVAEAWIKKSTGWWVRMKKAVS